MISTSGPWGLCPLRAEMWRVRSSAEKHSAVPIRALPRTERGVIPEWLFHADLMRPRSEIEFCEQFRMDRSCHEHIRYNGCVRPNNCIDFPKVNNTAWLPDFLKSRIIGLAHGLFDGSIIPFSSNCSILALIISLRLGGVWYGKDLRGGASPTFMTSLGVLALPGPHYTGSTPEITAVCAMAVSVKWPRCVASMSSMSFWK